MDLKVYQMITSDTEVDTRNVHIFDWKLKALIDKG